MTGRGSTTPQHGRAPADRALDPPRGTPRVTTTLTAAPLDVTAAWSDVGDPTSGGIGLFLGVVRDHHDGEAVDHLEYEAWEEQARPALEQVGAEVVARFPGVRAVHLAHRLGRLEVGDVSVVVATSAPHRAEALEATRVAIDLVKHDVPIWKHEFLADGSTRWPGC